MEEREIHIKIQCDIGTAAQTLRELAAIVELTCERDGEYEDSYYMAEIYRE